jgi:hypothetical protein
VAGHSHSKNGVGFASGPAIHVFLYTGGEEAGYTGYPVYDELAPA